MRDVSALVSNATPRMSAVSLIEFGSDLLSLTKPRIIVLLLITTCCPMIVASDGKPDLELVLLTMLGGALVSGSAGAVNCIWDRDIDGLMERTKGRPLPAGRLSVTSAWIFAGVLLVFGLSVLAFRVNCAAAAASLFGHLFYVLVYTVWLKRRTPQNIVIGGAAGAVPPIVGWIAVTQQIDPSALLLFLCVFLWTPPHFWALALNKNGDYRRAGVPMLPVVAGESRTVFQMLVYALLLLPTTVLLVLFTPQLGPLSLVLLTALSAAFCLTVLKLRNSIGGPPAERVRRAWQVFSFSLLYLALFFATLVVDVIFFGGGRA